MTELNTYLEQVAQREANVEAGPLAVVSLGAPLTYELRDRDNYTIAELSDCTFYTAEYFAHARTVIPTLLSLVRVLADKCDVSETRHGFPCWAHDGGHCSCGLDKFQSAIRAALSGERA